MKRNMVQTICFAVLTLSIAAAALAEDRGICSDSRVAGEWGYSGTGTLFLPPNDPAPVPFAIVGRWTLDAEGNVSGTQTSSLGGTTSEDMLTGTATVNSDCTGTLTVGIYDKGALARMAVWALVYVDGAREVRGILTSLVLPNGVSLPAVLTSNGKNLFRGLRQQDEQ